MLAPLTDEGIEAKGTTNVATPEAFVFALPTEVPSKEKLIGIPATFKFTVAVNVALEP
ncbi:hypothetical protein FCR2A7T_05700 [Flavobacterium cauense R2A-7]|nr:hypothetical protein FCR2A7T_05700 [Flavobacterium cauense R2A-7]